MLESSDSPKSFRIRLHLRRIVFHSLLCFLFTLSFCNRGGPIWEGRVRVGMTMGDIRYEERNQLRIGFPNRWFITKPEVIYKGEPPAVIPKEDRYPFGFRISFGNLMVANGAMD